MKTSPAQQHLADALTVLKRIQDNGKSVIKSTELKRVQLSSLVKNGFLRQILKGWYMPSRPDEQEGDSTPWFAAMREFIAGYCSERFGDNWHVSPDLSLSLHAGSTLLPKQVTVHSPLAKNGTLSLPNGCSLFDYKVTDPISADKVTMIGSLRVLMPETALIKAAPAFYRNHSRDAQIVLSGVRDVSTLLRELLEGGHSTIAGRLAGALRAVGRTEHADQILATMRSAGYMVTESNPFAELLPMSLLTRNDSRHALRIRLMWHEMRQSVLELFPQEPGTPDDIDLFMSRIEEQYQLDAYHSLSIEGYRVTDELIRRVSRGDWNPENTREDSEARNAMAARGYWLAHNEVMATIRRIFSGTNPGTAFRSDHSAWYRGLFSPSVDAGILLAADLAGYRNAQVYIRNAAHVPPSKEAVREMMPELSDLLEAESSSAVRGVLGHFIFVYIHPYMDGNGRIGRFLMNAMLASGGFSWTIIPVERRKEYMAALDAASFGGDIRPFAAFVRSCRVD